MFGKAFIRDEKFVTKLLDNPFRKREAPFIVNSSRQTVGNLGLLVKEDFASFVIGYCIEPMGKLVKKNFYIDATGRICFDFSDNVHGYLLSVFVRQKKMVHPTGKQFRFGLQTSKTKINFTFVCLVHPTGIEPISLVPETNVLSVELRVRGTP